MFAILSQFSKPTNFPNLLALTLSWCISHHCPPAVFRIVSSDIYDASPEILDSDFLLYHPHYIIITVKNVNSIRAQWYQYSINKLELDDPRHMYSNAKSNLKASLFVFFNFLIWTLLQIRKCNLNFLAVLQRKRLQNSPKNAPNKHLIYHFGRMLALKGGLFFFFGVWSPIFWCLKTSTFGKSARFQAQIIGLLMPKLEKRRPLINASIPPK